MFLYYLKTYLCSPMEIQYMHEAGLRTDKILRNNLFFEVDLLAFCVMPNHFHLLVQQHTTDGMAKLLKRLTTAYAMYFNKKYHRVGSLFQGSYKAVLVSSDEYLLHVSRYIHLNYHVLQLPEFYSRFTSYPYYLNIKRVGWVKPQAVLQILSRVNSASEGYDYRSFVEDYAIESQIDLGDLTLEDDV